jgi:hypothetical protein
MPMSRGNVVAKIGMIGQIGIFAKRPNKPIGCLRYVPLWIGKKCKSIGALAVSAKRLIQFCNYPCFR